MKKFLISYLGTVEIEAKNEDEAMDIAEKMSLSDIEFDPKIEEISSKNDEASSGYKKVPIYEVMTDDKWNSIGETMPLKEACDLWWNSICIWSNNKCIGHSWKQLDSNEYYVEIEDKQILGEELNKILQTKIKLVDMDEDSDGYPIVNAQLID